MNTLRAIVSKISNIDTLHIVEFDFHGQTLSMMSLELNKEIKVGVKVRLCIKASNVVITKDFDGKISHSNRLSVKIQSIENGQLLSSVTLACFDESLESIITARASKELDLKVGDCVDAFINASDLSIKEIVNV